MIALIAHDTKKPAMVNFCQTHLDHLWQTRCVATGNTGAILNRDLNLNVQCVADGPPGCGLIIDMIAEGKIHAVVFFGDTLSAQPHELEVMHACDVHNVPLATNPATAEAIMEMMKQAQNRCK